MDRTLPNFWEPSFWEPNIVLALHNYCKPNQVVFDVGANAGSLSMVMSRCVGPYGRVIAFEASPRNIAQTQHNLIQAGCSNVHLIHKAVWNKSYDTVPLYAGTLDVGDSIFPHSNKKEPNWYVDTISLDDIIDAIGKIPAIIKMDIERAEYDALLGSKKLLKDSKPFLILEQDNNDARCFNLLLDYGYHAVDLANYKKIDSINAYEKCSPVSNIIYIHSDFADTDPYLNEGEPEKIDFLDESKFSTSENGRISLVEEILLSPGRYRCEAHFTATRNDNQIIAGIESTQRCLVKHHTFTSFMANSYRNWVFHLEKETRITPYLEYLNGFDDTLTWHGATLYRYPELSKLLQPVLL